MRFHIKRGHSSSNFFPFQHSYLVEADPYNVLPEIIHHTPNFAEYEVDISTFEH